MDQYTQAAMAYLRSKRGVRNVAAETTTGVSELEIAKWENQNHPHELPEDYKAFLRISNGFRLKWDLIFHGEPVQLGDMCINKLKEVERVDINISTKDDRERSEPTQKYLNMHRERMPVGAFSIDKHCKCGRVALVYTRKEVGSKEVPEVWFQDLSGRWNFLSKTFMVYFRMMVAHLGLPNWQYRFTDYGMDPISSQWFHLLAPQNFVIDLNAPKVRQPIEERRKEKTRSASKVTTSVSGSSSASREGVSSSSAAATMGSKMKMRRMSDRSMGGSGLSTGRGDRASSSRRKSRQTSSEAKDFLRSAYRVRPKSAFN